MKRVSGLLLFFALWGLATTGSKLPKKHTDSGHHSLLRALTSKITVDDHQEDGSFNATITDAKLDSDGENEVVKTTLPKETQPSTSSANKKLDGEAHDDAERTAKEEQLRGSKGRASSKRKSPRVITALKKKKPSRHPMARAKSVLRSQKGKSGDEPTKKIQKPKTSRRPEPSQPRGNTGTNDIPQQSSTSEEKVEPKSESVAYTKEALAESLSRKMKENHMSTNVLSQFESTDEEESLLESVVRETAESNDTSESSVSISSSDQITAAGNGAEPQNNPTHHNLPPEDSPDGKEQKKLELKGETADDESLTSKQNPREDSESLEPSEEEDGEAGNPREHKTVEPKTSGAQTLAESRVGTEQDSVAPPQVGESVKTEDERGPDSKPHHSHRVTPKEGESKKEWRSRRPSKERHHGGGHSEKRPQVKVTKPEQKLQVKILPVDSGAEEDQQREESPRGGTGGGATPPPPPPMTKKGNDKQKIAEKILQKLKKVKANLNQDLNKEPTVQVHSSRKPAKDYSKAVIGVSLILIISTILLTIVGLHYRKISLESRRYGGHTLLSTEEEDLSLFNRATFDQEGFQDRYDSWNSLRH